LVTSENKVYCYETGEGGITSGGARRLRWDRGAIERNDHFDKHAGGGIRGKPPGLRKAYRETNK